MSHAARWRAGGHTLIGRDQSMYSTFDQSVRDRCKELGLAVYDTALPQPWVDSARAYGLGVLGHFVWCYDGAGVFGAPVALTLEGESMLGCIIG